MLRDACASQPLSGSRQQQYVRGRFGVCLRCFPLLWVVFFLFVSKNGFSKCSLDSLHSGRDEAPFMKDTEVLSDSGVLKEEDAD